jgi:hypothetical protein
MIVGLKESLIYQCDGDDTYDEGFHYVWNSWKLNESKFIDSWGPVTLVVKEGEYPDGYNVEDVLMVFKLHNSETYWQVEGKWSSYDGQDWNQNLKQVFPHEKVITVYQ